MLGFHHLFARCRHLSAGPWPRCGRDVTLETVFLRHRCALLAKGIASLLPSQMIPIERRVTHGNICMAARSRRNARCAPDARQHLDLKMLNFQQLSSRVIFVTNALVQCMSICYMQRAGQVSALPRAVVAELVDAQWKFESSRPHQILFQ